MSRADRNPWLAKMVGVMFKLYVGVMLKLYVGVMFKLYVGVMFKLYVGVMFKLYVVFCVSILPLFLRFLIRFYNCTDGMIHGSHKLLIN
jgi:hypothetical protein